VIQEASSAAPTTLCRALGRWDFTAIGVNQVIGGAVFLLPASVAAQLGGWSGVGFLLAGFASMLVALCFAELGSRFESTGGPYIYTRAAFGRFAAFEVGWMQWFTRVSAQAAIMNGIAISLGFYWPALTLGVGRAAVIALVIFTLAWINVRGIRQSASVVKALTIGKLIPLAIFIAVGVFFVDWTRVIPANAISVGQLASGALLLMFAFGGYDVIPLPAGEAKYPTRHVPFAAVTTILVVTAVMAMAQIVAQGSLADVAHSKTPLADAAFVSMGSAGALLIGIGAVVSMTGNTAGAVLAGSRILFALGENRELPSWFARIHPRFRTPANAVLFSSTVALLLAWYGSFEKLAIASAVARLVPYISVCASTLMLRRSQPVEEIGPARFVIPFGPAVPLLGVLVSLAILAGATTPQLIAGLSALIVGAILFLVGSRSSSVSRAFRRPLVRR
jgi:basic amino acid/polyamine antiporter, APA family